MQTIEVFIPIYTIFPIPNLGQQPSSVLMLYYRRKHRHLPAQKCIQFYHT